MRLAAGVSWVGAGVAGLAGLLDVVVGASMKAGFRRSMETVSCFPLLSKTRYLE